MRAFGCVVVCCGVLASGAAAALDGRDPPLGAAAPAKAFANPVQALIKGLEVYRSGDFASSVPALEYAAEGGQPLAQWKLARMYAVGDGVPRDDVKAFQYYSRVVDGYDEDDPDRRDLSVVSSAFVAVGVYNLNGLPAASLRPDPDRARRMFQFAATSFGDANAQYDLARMYLDGSGVAKDARQAMRWFKLAADKNHMPAQALLGNMLFAGQGGVQRQRAQGLMWLTLAREQAGTDAANSWVVDLYDAAIKQASDADRQVALVYLGDQLKRR